VLGVLAVLALIHLARGLLSDAQDQDLVWALAFVPARYGPGGADIAGGALARFMSPVTHMLLHGDISHLLINGAWLLVFGSPIARRLGPVRFLLFLGFCGICGALTFWLLNPELEVPMIGASGAISGLMGGLLRVLFSVLDRRRSGSADVDVQDVPRLTLRQVLTDRRAMGTIIIWVALNVALATGLGDYAPGAVAWEAHLGGFFAGLLSFALFDVAPAGRGSPAN
jgi:membrane associated rhomboid family serine protease